MGKTKTVPIILSFFLLALFLEAFLQGIYRIKNGEYTWEAIGKVEIFQIPYLKQVSDKRYVVPDPSYQDEQISF